MAERALPQDLKGQWIWKLEDPDTIDDHAFFRREFTLDGSPTAAEIWITARSLFHLYVNGRYICYGPSPATGRRTYVSRLDIGHCLQVGKNVIAVLAHNTRIPRSTVKSRASGLWCQLQADNQPLVWSDESWVTHGGECYNKRQPRLSRASGFVESLDLRKYPHGWAEIDFDSSAWEPVGTIHPPDFQKENFSPLPNFDVTAEKFPFDNLIYRGQILQDKTTTHVYFSAAVKRPKGLYVAETFVKIDQDVNDVVFYLFADDPYCFFVNGRLVKSQGVPRSTNYGAPVQQAAHCYQQSRIGNVDGTLSLQSGWNRLVFYQQVELHSAGATFVFPEIADGDIKFVKGMTSFGLPGWNIAGPLNVPLSHAEASISLEGFPPLSYYAIHPCDESAHLLSYSYETNPPLNQAVDYVDLRANEYAVFDLEDYHRGIIELIITGKPGDLVSIVHGEYMQGNVVSPFDQGIRRATLLTLTEGSALWRSVAPHGMKYLMIVIRHAAEVVNIQQIGLRDNTVAYPQQNEFSCADELLNQFWDFGKITVNATHDYVFLDSGSYLESQTLADATIQGLASLYVYGTKEMSAKGLREFAEAQYETGEIPSIAPSDLDLRYQDAGLLWPVWLYHHVSSGGDTALLTELAPNLKRLLKYYRSIGDPTSGVLGNQQPPYRNHCLIDYDETVDKRGVSTGLNALYCYSLLKCEWLFDFLDMKEDAEACVKLASEIAATMRGLTWNAEAGLFADAWYDGKPCEQRSLQSNVLALLGGVAEPDQYENIFNTFFFEYAPYQDAIKDKANENPYFKFFILEMAFTLNLRDWALEYMRYYWGKLVQAGATSWWNKFSPDIEFSQEQAQSMCHGYGVSPNIFLIREVAGIRLANPEASRIIFSPILTACEWLKVKFQTLRGAIRVEWSHQESGVLQLQIESEYPLEVVPQLDPSIATNPTIHINDNVKIVEA